MPKLNRRSFHQAAAGATLAYRRAWGANERIRVRLAVSRGGG